MKVLDFILQSPAISQRPISREGFYQLLIKECQLLGVAEPEKSFKEGGLIGKKYLDLVTDHLYWLQKDSPLCPSSVSVFGAVASQEILKVLSAMYLPIHQILLLENLSLLSRDSLPAEKSEKSESRRKKETKTDHLLVPSQTAFSQLYGERVMQRLRSMRIFVIGAGAIGCELLKNLALLGIGTGGPEERSHSSLSSHQTLWEREHLQDGGILVTDMDLIEKSNLNRQFLFRPEHIGASKAQIAARQIQHMNPAIRISPLTLKVSSETEMIFDEAFWRSTDLVITALVRDFLSVLMKIITSNGCIFNRIMWRRGDMSISNVCGISAG